MAFSISNFKAQTLGQVDYLRPTKFELYLTMPKSLQGNPNFSNLKAVQNHVQFYCEAAAIPGVGLSTHNVRTYGYGVNESRPVFAQFQKLNLSILADANGDNWTFFKEWISSIVNFDSSRNFNGVTGYTSGTQMAAYELGYRNDYVSDGFIVSYDNQGNVGLVVFFKDMYPMQLADIQTNWGQTGQLMRIPVVMSYFDWYVETNGGNTPNGVTQAPTTGQDIQAQVNRDRNAQTNAVIQGFNETR